ncbi:MAG TPA: ScpA family protein [Candidatus Paceibacterota bacterium]|nr:ScpA family protein [Candidatus Paceibacterota bacterium]
MESVTTPSYTVRTASYEGPLELLLDLIEKRKLHVNELSLAEVTDDFIQHVRGQAEFPMEEAANFISVAATLLLIKSKSLIPELALSEDEEEDVEDLKRRLLMYEKAREAARELSRIFGRAVLVSRGERAPEPMFAPSRDLSPETLTAALRNALTEAEKQEQLPEVRVKPLITIEEMMDRLTDRVQTALAVSFKEFSGGAKEKVEVIVSFLALLELVKQGVVDAAQHDHFADIKITNTAPTTPKYG